MNSRERLLVALNGQMPDRVPISTYELVGHNSRSWENDLRFIDAAREYGKY